MELTGPAPGSRAHELVITREFSAPRELVYSLWTTPEHVLRWWAPNEDGESFTTPHCELDFRPGGTWRICIRSPKGRDYWSHGSYREIAPPERLAFSFRWEMVNGQPGHDTEISVDFTALPDARTRMEFRQTPFYDVADRDSHIGGWNGCFEKLDDYAQQLAGGQ